MVVTAHPLATDTALDVLKEGGNAVDAAIAAQWVLNVVEPHSSGIGGGGFFLFYEKTTGRVYTLDGREKAPEETVPYMYLDDARKPIPYIPDRVTGGHSVGVPGTLKLLKTVHDRFGSEQFFFSSLFEPAIQLAEQGFPISNRLAKFIEEHQDRLILFEASGDIFLDESARALQEGHILVQSDLAETFRLIQREGIRVFYEGEIAHDIVECVRTASYRPGTIKISDLTYYDVKERNAILGNYRGYQIFSMGPPSSGGTTLVEALNILESFDLASLGRDAEFMHIFSEAQKLAFQDRNVYLGDPDFSKIPVVKIIAKNFAYERAQKIRLDRVLPTAKEEKESPSSQTSHISVVDAEGNMVSFTTTIEHVFGSAMVVPGRGFLLNNELSDFDAVPWDENRELKANAPESEKRPRSSMTPTFVFRQGEPLVIVGTPGGSTIIATVMNILVNLIDFKMNLTEALRAARIVNRDGAMELEREITENALLMESLKEKGNTIQVKEPLGNAQAIFFDRESGQIVGESDPRGEGKAAGF